MIDKNENVVNDLLLKILKTERNEVRTAHIMYLNIFDKLFRQSILADLRF